MECESWKRPWKLTSTPSWAFLFKRTVALETVKVPHSNSQSWSKALPEPRPTSPRLYVSPHQALSGSLSLCPCLTSRGRPPLTPPLSVPSQYWHKQIREHRQSWSLHWGPSSSSDPDTQEGNPLLWVPLSSSDYYHCGYSKI